jgi:hypothetical protein
MVNAETDPDVQKRIDAFRRGLQQMGWSEGRNVQIDYRTASARRSSPRRRSGPRSTN